MRRFGTPILVVVALAACEPDGASTAPEPVGAAEVAAPEPAEPGAEPEPEASAPAPSTEPAEAAPAPEPATEVSAVAEAVVKHAGFEARDLQCALSEPTRNGDRYIIAGFSDPEVDAALDACAPKGAAIEVEWSYVGGQASDIAVVAGSPKQANCIAAAMTKVRAGVSAKCSVVLLVGDLAAATAAYEAR